MTLRKIWWLGALAPLALAGCGSKSQTTVEANTTTVGQELEDLEKAHDSGLITESEYKEQRAAILKRNTK